MQVFRPYIDWKRSAQVLDNKRLGKQRVEAKQVMIVILRKMGLINDGKRGWLNHPVVLMYYNNGKPYFYDLVNYFNACVEEWRHRNMESKISLADIEELIKKVKSAEGHPLTHKHEIEYRRVLILKNPEHYLKVFPIEEVREVFERRPVMISGVNSWIFRNKKLYELALGNALNIAMRMGIV
ncbi:MAG: pyrimidine dimer DNA glycosylase/endonuclease V [Nitrososphaerota archaeon]